jgi:hypothetical protein
MMKRISDPDWIETNPPDSWDEYRGQPWRSNAGSGTYTQNLSGASFHRAGMERVDTIVNLLLVISVI